MVLRDLFGLMLTNVDVSVVGQPLSVARQAMWETSNAALGLYNIRLLIAAAYIQLLDIHYSIVTTVALCPLSAVRRVIGFVVSIALTLPTQSHGYGNL